MPFIRYYCFFRENAFLISFIRQYRDGGHGFNDFNDVFGNRGLGGFDFGSRFFGGSGSSNYPEWFETPKDDLTCKDVPAVVNAGRPPGDVCLAVSPNFTFELDQVFLTY
jgi:hypothetical protein